MRRSRGRPPGSRLGPHPLPNRPPPSVWPAPLAPPLPGAAAAAPVVAELLVVPPNPEATAYDHEKQAALCAYHQGERRARRIARCQKHVIASFGAVVATLAAVFLVRLVGWALTTWAWPAGPAWPAWPVWSVWPVGEGGPNVESDAALLLRERLDFGG